jgi:uncharacterized protein (DUF1800 family)
MSIAVPGHLRVALASLCLVLAGCGGGGGSSSATAGSSGGATTATSTTAGSTGATALSAQDRAASLLDATRLAQQASFGATESLVQTIAAQGSEAWVAAQLRTSGSAYSRGGSHDVHTWTDKTSGYCDAKGPNCWRDNFSAEPLLWDFYRNALTQPDQLRQRVAFALQQILVVSDEEVSGTYGLRNYQNLLLAGALGNYGSLLRQVALSPVMGDYLNNVNNSKAAPNENFARELLQLFSLGTCTLNADGTLAGGACQPVYDNDLVRRYAFALTGWTYPAGGRSPWSCGPAGVNCRWYDGDMVPVPSLHDTTARTLLGGVSLPAGHTPSAALDGVVQSLLGHANIGPFIGRQLIQHLVTSNPSPAYVQRVAAAFNSGSFSGPTLGFGSGQRGDLAATVAAVLLDAEARTAGADGRYGKLREPALHMTGVLRALQGHTDGEALSWWWGGTLRQHVFKAPTVFSFYPPDYPLPGNASLVAPTFALHNASTALGRLNFLHYLLFWGGTDATASGVPEPLGTGVDLSGFVADAADAAKLVDRFATLALGAPLPAAQRGLVIDAVSTFDSKSDRTNWQTNRVRQAAYLVFASPHFQIQR